MRSRIVHTNTGKAVTLLYPETAKDIAEMHRQMAEHEHFIAPDGTVEIGEAKAKKKGWGGFTVDIPGAITKGNACLSCVAKGDVTGHEFHGNQFTGVDSPPPQKDEIQTVCSYCKKVMQESPVQPPKAVSHGICPDCNTRVLAEWRASRKPKGFTVEVEKGDLENHPFRGNQYTVVAMSDPPNVEWRSGKVNAEEFIAARSKSTRAGFLSPLTPDDLKDSELHLSEDGKVGYALTNGDFGNLFNNGGERGAGQTAMLRAIATGNVKTADCFDGYLTKLYVNYGLKATNAMKFNDEYAPPGWNYERDGRPDVVFLSYQGGNPKTLRERVGTFGTYKHPKKWTDDYAEAQADARRRVVAR